MNRGMCTRAALAITVALLALACGDDDDGVTPVDGGGEDAGPVSCVAEMENAASTAGCNGGFQGTPAMNDPGGRCELGTDAMPEGSCTAEMAICMGDLAGSAQGWCVITCAAPASLVDAQTCPTGYRCFRNGEGTEAWGLCYRDCDAEHPCQDGWTCNTDFGRCEETPPT